MFPHSDNPRKRALESDEDLGLATGFGEHRAKRQMASLPHRGSPRNSQQSSLPWGLYPPQPAPPTITPADSDDEETPAASEPKSFFSPFSSSPTQTLTPSSPFLDSLNSSQSTQMSDAAIYSDDCEMADSVHLSPGPFQPDSLSTISSRVPTPIHSSFIRDIRQEKAHRHNDPDFADDESIVDKIRRVRRLPSPISEGELSPSFIAEGIEDMQMDIEPERETTTKKGHSRSKHSLRSWTNVPGEDGDNGSGLKKSFTMGYRPDCEKCRNKVEGHFIHIIVR